MTGFDVSGRDAMGELTCDEVREMAGSFVLGALEPQEEAALRAHLATCPDRHAEIAQLGSVLPALAEAVPMVEPSDLLKARIMAAAAGDSAARGGAPGVAAARVAPVAFPTADQRAARRTRTSVGGWLLRIAAVLVIAVLGGWNVLLQNDLSAARSYERSVAAVLDSAARPGSLTAILTADGGTGSGLAAVDADGNAALAMHDLAPTSGNAVYQAWVIAADGVPVPLGGFQVGQDGTGSFRASGLPTADGIVLALTLEAGPGATTPTMPIISKGVAAAPR
jgi:anti-sigma-K factor RskA